MTDRPLLTFLGATGTVTGSKYLLQTSDARILVDCGLFQGPRKLRQRNWSALPLAASELDAVFLTHAHLDHTGYLPVLCKHGFKGPIYCTPGTAALARILLPDSGHLQEEDARYANRKGYSKHRPARALYTQQEAEDCLQQLVPVESANAVMVSNDLRAKFHVGGHILGASWITLDLGGRRITFSGDLGRQADPVMMPPAPLEPTDYLVIESTYGNRRHDERNPLDQLKNVVLRTIGRGGVVMIPAFAVGRAQTVLHLLSILKTRGVLPEVPVYLNSPMAINATTIFCDHEEQHRLSPAECAQMCDIAGYVNSADDSRALNERRGPMIVISASGMASGGRILHHFKAWIGDPNNTVLFTGFQAAGTRGAAMVAGGDSIKIHGQKYAIRAEIEELTSLSAHADSDELVGWLEPLRGTPPRLVFVTHGEAMASHALRARIQNELGMDAQVPLDGQSEVL